MMTRRRPTPTRSPASDARLRAMKRSLGSAYAEPAVDADEIYHDLERSVMTRLTNEELDRFDRIDGTEGQS